MNFIQKQAIRAGVSMISPMILEVLPEFTSWLFANKSHITKGDDEEPILTIFESEKRLILSVVIINKENVITRQLVNFDLGILITNLDKILTWFFEIKNQDRVPSLKEVMTFYETLTDNSDAE